MRHNDKKISSCHFFAHFDISAGRLYEIKKKTAQYSNQSGQSGLKAKRKNN